MNRQLTLQVRDHHFYHSAARLAEHGEHRVRVGCIAAVNNKKIAGAFNTYRNDPKITNYGNATYHAEWNVARMVPERLRTKVTLYIARINQADENIPSVPCSKCAVELRIRGFNELVYMDKKGSLVKVRVT